MTGLLHDFRYALRQIRRSPGFASLPIVTLALGIGANTAIFSMVDAAVLHPLPFSDAGGIMALWWTDSRPGGALSGLAAVTDPDSVEWVKQSTLFSQIAFYRGQTFNLTGVNDPVRLLGEEVSASLFPLLDSKPLLGRTFLPEEQSPSRDHVVILSHKLWQSRFSADPAIVGRSIALGGQLFTVVGVMPARFDFPNDTEFWTPLTVGSDGSNATLKLLARLKSGVSLDQARAETVLIARRLGAQAHRNPDGQLKTDLVPLEKVVGSESRVSMFTLFAAVALLLLIGCTNVANLMLARAAGRAHEIAVRNSLGATRRRIVRQLAVESSVIAGLGGLLGLFLAFAGRGLLASAAAALPRSLASPSAAARIQSSSIDHPVLLFTLAISVLTGILFGLAPVIQGSGKRSNSALRTGNQHSIGFLGKGRLRDVLVVTEIALAFVLLSGAGLLMRSFIKLVEIDPGFETRNVLTMNLELPESRYQTHAQMVAFEEHALENMQKVPSVMSAASVFGLPLGDILIRGDVEIENQPAPPPDSNPAKILVGGDYFNAIGIPVRSGRPFAAHDSAGSPHVVIVSQSLARRFWPNQDPIGRRIKPGFSNDSWCTVVGVVGDVRQFDLQDSSGLAIYLPYAQSPTTFLMQSLALVVRSRSDDPSATVSAARRAIASVDPDLPLFDVASMDQLVHRSLSEPRFNTFLLGLFATLALLLAALGTYGVMSCVVTARTSEIGVRIALGASQRDVLRQILGRVLLLATSGLALGLLGTTMASRFLVSLLYNVRPTDIATYVVVAIMMMTASLFAGYFPARRAAKVDPIVALRYE